MSSNTKITYVRNLNSGELKKYESLSDASKSCGFYANSVAVYVGRYIYKGMWWIYHPGQSEFPPESHRHSSDRGIEVWIKELASGQVRKFSSISEAGKHTKLGNRTIKIYMRDNLPHKGLIFSSTGIFPKNTRSNIVTPSWLKKRDYIAEPCN